MGIHSSFFCCTLFLCSCFRLDVGNRNRLPPRVGLFETSRLWLFGTVLDKAVLAIFPLKKKKPFLIF